MYILRILEIILDHLNLSTHVQNTGPVPMNRGLRVSEIRKKHTIMADYTLQIVE